MVVVAHGSTFLCDGSACAGQRRPNLGYENCLPHALRILSTTTVLLAKWICSTLLFPTYFLYKPATCIYFVSLST